MPQVAKRRRVSNVRSFSRTRRYSAALTFVLILVSHLDALAESPKSGQSFAQSTEPGAQAKASDQKQAAVLYDSALRHYERAEYAEAAQKFLAADELLPSSEALSNAIAAARKAHEHLLVAIACERAIEREDKDPKLAASARQALADARPHLSRLEIECSSSPCELSLDGKPVSVGRVYTVPGIYVLHAKGPNNSTAEERLRTNPGATYRVVLHPEAEAGTPSAKTEVTHDETVPKTKAPPVRESRPLSPAVFYTTAAISAALVGLTIWSGIDTLNAKNDLPKNPRAAENDEVKSRVLRTDLLLAGAVVMTGFTAYSGFFLVDFTSDDKPSGFNLGIRGKF